ncbi:MAG: RNA pseudouridine synthase, partial [Thiotrichales bacterium]
MKRQRIEKHLKVEVSGIIAIDLLSEHVALSRQQLKSAMSNGAVWLESQHGIRRIRRAKKELAQGDILHLY